MPVQRATMRAISSSVTLSRNSVLSLLASSAIFSCSASCFLQLREVCRILVRQPGPGHSCALLLPVRPGPMPARFLREASAPCPIDVLFVFPARFHGVGTVPAFPLVLFECPLKRSADKRLSSSFFSAASSISCCMMFRQHFIQFLRAWNPFRCGWSHKLHRPESMALSGRKSISNITVGKRCSGDQGLILRF